MIRCLAIDDETPALDILEDNISRIPFLQLEARCKNVYEAMQALQTGTIDLIFLDIQMPGINGTSFLRNLSTRPMVVFITAYKKYAIDGFDLDVLDYLVKPVSFERFLKAAGKALEYYNLRSKEPISPQTIPSPASSPPDLAIPASGPAAIPAASSAMPSDYLFINTEYRLVKVFLHEITHIEALNNYIKIHLTGSCRPVLSRSSLKTFEERLPAGQFARVHKSFIVFIDKISSIEREYIKIGTTAIPISKSYREAFLKQIGAKNIK